MPQHAPRQPDPADLKALAALFNQGRFAEATARARALAEASPDCAFCWKALGTALLALGQGEQAEPACARAAALLPGDPQAHVSHGIALRACGREADAEAALRRALVLKPKFPEALANLGNTLHAQKRHAEAEQALRQAVALAPDNAQMLANLGAALNALSRHAEAEDACRRAVALAPRSAQAHNNLGTALNGQRRYAEAGQCFRQALAIKPGYPEALNNLGNALHELGRLHDAEECFRQGLAARPADAQTLSNLGNVLHTLGRLAEAEIVYRRALALAPDAAFTRSNLLFVLSHDPACAPADYLTEAKRYGETATRAADEPYAEWLCEDLPCARTQNAGDPQPDGGLNGPRPNGPSPNGPLRVGFVSGDLRGHPVGHFLEAWLPFVDPAELRLSAYPTVTGGDALTERIRPCFADWTPIAGLDDAEAAARIRRDGAHVLFDLSGHTAGNRLGVFARRPAPVQASWLGYFASTGLEQMDFLLADAIGAPEADAAHYTEILLRLPETRLCCAPPREAPAVAPLPARTTGRVTFGCFQNMTKIGGGVLEAWAAILATLPGARLRVQNRQLSDPAVAADLRRRLARLGVEPARVALCGGVDRAAYLAAHAEVDMILDTFPYPGGTTTCEALWMGVPTLTLAGRGLLGRQGACLLTAAGLPDWVAATPADYVAKAVALTADEPALTALERLRDGLRARVAASPLFDAALFARRFTQAVWRMWTLRQALVRPKITPLG
ncbi:MAG: hypothetical protein AUJ49_07225 [Desulfovibrionaceae bacterium CG1_02_65_16]|nr:MAG: hypothetical protein AUJ49_07225 [Desulfovibrionaceae bacterium CG1_02_65_16]